jgi:hypothetical protein
MGRATYPWTDTRLDTGIRSRMNSPWTRREETWVQRNACHGFWVGPWILREAVRHPSRKAQTWPGGAVLGLEAVSSTSGVNRYYSQIKAGEPSAGPSSSSLLVQEGFPPGPGRAFLQSRAAFLQLKDRLPPWRGATYPWTDTNKLELYTSTKTIMNYY